LEQNGILRLCALCKPVTVNARYHEPPLLTPIALHSNDTSEEILGSFSVCRTDVFVVPWTCVPEQLIIIQLSLRSAPLVPGKHIVNTLRNRAADVHRNGWAARATVMPTTRAAPFGGSGITKDSRSEFGRLFRYISAHPVSFAVVVSIRLRSTVQAFGIICARFLYGRLQYLRDHCCLLQAPRSR
jgi:hypothetical protein